MSYQLKPAERGEIVNGRVCVRSRTPRPDEPSVSSRTHCHFQEAVVPDLKHGPARCAIITGVKTLRIDEILEHYHQQYGDVPGFFGLESQAIWDFFLRAQADLGVGGDFLEIGVYKGKSAILAALHLRQSENAVLVDLNPVPETRAVLEKVRPGANVYIEGTMAVLGLTVVLSLLRVSSSDTSALPPA